VILQHGFHQLLKKLMTCHTKTV